MKLGAVLLVKDEEDIAYHTILNFAEEEVDVIIVADNMSTDKTLSELNKAKSLLRGICHVEILKDEEVGYYQSKKMTNLAKIAHDDFGCDWIIASDFDEVWYSKTDTIKKTIEALPDEVNVITAGLYNHFPTAMDIEDIIPFKSIVYRQIEKGALPKVAMNINLQHRAGMLLQNDYFPFPNEITVVSENSMDPMDHRLGIYFLHRFPERI